MMLSPAGWSVANTMSKISSLLSRINLMYGGDDWKRIQAALWRRDITSRIYRCGDGQSHAGEVRIRTGIQVFAPHSHADATAVGELHRLRHDRYLELLSPPSPSGAIGGPSERHVPVVVDKSCHDDPGGDRAGPTAALTRCPRRAVSGPALHVGGDQHVVVVIWTRVFGAHPLNRPARGAHRHPFPPR